ncbi:MAG: putative bifunctional diguanylate cyclase/phosphodiesterase [Paracoccaceae bacterium]
MLSALSSKFQYISRRLRAALVGPQMLAFVPAITLGSFWFGGEGMLLILALVFPAAFAVAGLFSGTGPAWASARDRETNLRFRPAAVRKLGEILKFDQSIGKTTAALVISLDDFPTFQRQYGAEAATSLLKQAADRLVTAIRDPDEVMRLDGPRFAIALGPVRRADLESLVQISARLQGAISEPFSIDATSVYVTASVGFCLASHVPDQSGATLLEMAEQALEAALANGNGSIRAYSPETKQRKIDRTISDEEVENALENGQILPWFQPQVSTNTGEISGFEALARWIHPERGLIPPADFLPTLQENQLLERLCEIILSRSLSALRHWDKSGLAIPRVAVNFSSQELSNPKLCDRLNWELDRFELTPDRLCVEILEDVIAVSKDDVIIRNIQAMANMGCRIDLDDFGTGHASIANIRRYSVNRIKIDRSFITRVDRDRDQQSMVSAILTMAERLDIDTLAEGVETIGEHAILSQLGCGHVQGFSVAKPMPFEETEKWIIRYRENLPSMPNVDRIAG